MESRIADSPKSLIAAGAEWQVAGGDLPAEIATAKMIDGIAQRYGQHPDAIIGGDTFVFRMMHLLDAFGLLNPGAKSPGPPPANADPTGLGGFMETI